MSIPISPERNRPYDKFERSPNNCASCRVCHCKITKGTIRAGVQVYDYAHNRMTGPTWFPFYFHAACISPDDIGRLYLKSSSAENGTNMKNEFVYNKRSPVAALEAATAKGQLEINILDKEEAQKQTLLVQRHELRERIRKRRFEIAQSKSKPTFMIFSDAALDEIVSRMPSNSKELLDCRGIGRRKELQYGPWILQFIHDWKAAKKGAPTSVQQSPIRTVANQFSHRGVLRENLRVKRLEIAQKRGDPAFKVFSNATLDDIVEKMPTTNGALYGCKGIGYQKLREHGPWIIQCILEHIQLSTTEASTTRSSASNTLVIQNSTTPNYPRYPYPVVTPETKSMSARKEEDNDIDSIEVEKTLCFDEVLQQRYLKAEEKGEVITL